MLNVMREMEATSRLGPTRPAESPAASVPIDLRILEFLAREPFDTEVVLERLVRSAHQD